MDTSSPLPLTRRHALLGLGAAAGSLALGSRGSAAGSPAAQPGMPSTPPQNGSGFYRFKVGDVQCYSIGDSQARLPSYPLWGENASQEAVEAALRAAALPPAEPMLMHFNVLYFKIGSEHWLVDAGNGPSEGNPGQLLRHLATLGVKPEDINGIVLSHLHGDHFAGLFTKDEKLAFPNAKYFLNKTERDFWSGPAPDLSKSNLNADWKKSGIAAAAKTIAALQASGKLEIVDDGAKLSTGLFVRQTGGHTPGHQTLVIDSGGQKFEMLVDAVHHYVLSFRHPEWHVHFDFDAKEGARIRRSVMQRVAADQSLVMCYHTPWPGVGRVKPRDDAFEWLPVPWEW
jgi:glyoxylase-like metal-dependent hydrolase (beta-lactamase superfamily II)